MTYGLAQASECLSLAYLLISVILTAFQFFDLSKQKNVDIEIETMIVSDNHERCSLMSKFRNRIVQVCHDDDNMLDD